MVQALINNTNIQTKSNASDFMASGKNPTADFQKIIDKQTNIDSTEKKFDIVKEVKNIVEKSDVKQTLGDVKQNIAEEFSNEWTSFQNLLKEVTNEIAGENSLNLSLEGNEDEAGVNSDDAATGLGQIEDWITPIESDEEDSDITIGEELPTEDSEMVLENAVQTAIQLSIQQNKDSEKVDITQNIESNEEELNVTINGKGLAETLDELTLNSSTVDEVVQLNVPKTEIETTDAKALEELVDEDTLKDLNIESVETEVSSDGGAGEDLMQNQSAQEQGVKAMIQADGEFVVNQTTEVKPINTVNTVKQSVHDSNPARILEQVAKQMEGLANNSKVNIVLNPESLGKVSVQLINTKEGLSAQFTVATQDARNALMKGLDSLKETLLSQGINVDNVSVKMSETPDGKHNSDWTEREGSRGGNKEQNPRERGNKQEFEKMMSFMNFEEENGNV